MEDRALARYGRRPTRHAPPTSPREEWLTGSEEAALRAAAARAAGVPRGGVAGAQIDLVVAERITASVDRLLAAVPADPSPVAARRWLLAAERLLPLSGEYDRARLLQARAGVRSVAGTVDAGRSTDATLHDAADAGELFEHLGDPLAAATNFAVAASTAARDGRITLALETAVRALVALGRAVRNGDRADRDPIAEAQLAARLGALCRQLFDYPRALRFYELALDALDGSGPGERGAAATLAVAELLLIQAGDLPPDAPSRPVLLERAERLALELAAGHAVGDGSAGGSVHVPVNATGDVPGTVGDVPGTGSLAGPPTGPLAGPLDAPPDAYRAVHGPRLLADVRCEHGRPDEAWPLLCAARDALGAGAAGPGAVGLSGPVHLSSGRCLLLLGRLAEAVAELDLAVEILGAPSDPGEPHLAEFMTALRLRSSAREGCGDVRGALADERRLADLLWLRHRRHVGGFMDQVWSRAGAEEERRDLQERTEALLVHAEQDPLTGLANRRAIERFCGQLLPGGDVSLVLIDVDHFKDVNDHFGHAVGDAVLRTLAGVLTRSVRTMDVVARWGGEEFLIALPGGSGRLGADAADRVCRRVRTHPWRRLVEGLNVTVSAGIASGPASELDVVLGRADAALYQAKHGGRDRAVVG
jgi:diguanylate cyclase (GGDEF)-like protein